MGICGRTKGVGLSLIGVTHKDSAQVDRASIFQGKDRKWPRGTAPRTDHSSVSVSKERLSSKSVPGPQGRRDKTAKAQVLFINKMFKS